MQFDDDITFNTSGELRVESRSDGLYVVGRELLCPVDSDEEGKQLIAELSRCLLELEEIPRKVWNRDEAHALVELGLPWAEKLELINGELIDHMGKKRPHVIWQSLMHEWLSKTFGAERVEFESPNDVAAAENEHSEPEPDLKVLARPSRAYPANPTPEDILLVVEIADSTVAFDLTVKAPLYARAGIIEYWVLNVQKKLLIVHRNPLDGVYQHVSYHGAMQPVTPMAAPEALLYLEHLWPSS